MELFSKLRSAVAVTVHNYNLKMRIKTTTKVNLTRWLCILSLSGGTVLPFHRAAAQTDQDLIEVARSVVSADRKAVVVAAMDLTEAEGNDFCPLYREYRSAMDKIADERMKLVLNYAKLYPNVPDGQAKEMLSTYTGLEQKQVEKRNVYLEKFSKVLPAAKALRFAQVETRLDLLIHLNLAASVPLTPITQTK